MRLRGPVQFGQPRYPREDVELGGVTIPAGSPVTPLLLSANTDPREFADPSALDLTRETGRGEGHLGFGQGPHYCLGAALARQEAEVALRALFERFPDLVGRRRRRPVGAPARVQPGHRAPGPPRLTGRRSPAGSTRRGRAGPGRVPTVGPRTRHGGAPMEPGTDTTATRAAMDGGLRATARRLVGGGRGILAADESVSTMSKRLEEAGVPASAEHRRAYRELLVTTDGLSDGVNGVILCDETLRQRFSDGRSFGEGLTEAGMLPGIKVDTGAAPLAGADGETVTEGLRRARGAGRPSTSRWARGSRSGGP